MGMRTGAAFFGKHLDYMYEIEILIYPDEYDHSGCGKEIGQNPVSQQKARNKQIVVDKKKNQERYESMRHMPDYIHVDQRHRHLGAVSHGVEQIESYGYEPQNQVDDGFG